MAASMRGRERSPETDDTTFNGDPGPAEASPGTIEQPKEPVVREHLPWIGALPNPQVGPMVVLNESGYLVPLCTVSDLLRGCRYFWRV